MKFPWHLIQVQVQNHKSKSFIRVPISYVSSSVYSVSLICHKMILGHSKTHYDFYKLFGASPFDVLWVWSNFLFGQLQLKNRQCSEIAVVLDKYRTHTPYCTIWYKLNPSRPKEQLYIRDIKCTKHCLANMLYRDFLINNAPLLLCQVKTNAYCYINRNSDIFVPFQ